MDTDVIIYAIIFAALALWLRSILGTRGADEPTRSNPFSAPDSAAPLKPNAPAARLAAPAAVAPAATLAPNMSVGDAAQDGFSAIARADRKFDLARFMHGAQDAFVIIVEAFAQGDRATLRGLLGDGVYAAFARVLDARAAAGQSASVEIHAVRRVEAVAASLTGQLASVTMRFVSDQTDVLRDGGGAVALGNPDRVQEVVDVWTFTRDLQSREPTWLVAVTREEAADNAVALPAS